MTGIATGMENMLAAYMNEYGKELFDTLTAELDIVEGEVIDDESEETEGSSDEIAGMVASDDGFDSEPLSEDLP